jgi:hypothetical protein
MQVCLCCVGLQKQHKSGKGDNQKMARLPHIKKPSRARLPQMTTASRLPVDLTAPSSLSHLPDVTPLHYDPDMMSVSP